LFAQGIANGALQSLDIEVNARFKLSIRAVVGHGQKRTPKRIDVRDCGVLHGLRPCSPPLLERSQCAADRCATT